MVHYYTDRKTKNDNVIMVSKTVDAICEYKTHSFIPVI